MAEIIKKLVAEEDNDIRLDRWFKRHYKEYSFANISKLARTGQIRVDSKRVKASDKIRFNQEIRFPALIVLPKPQAKGSITTSKNDYAKLVEEITANIIYINSHILVLNKPASLAVQSGNGIEISVDHIASELKFDAKEKPKLVHRIDKETSGILVMARNIKAAQEIADIFQNREIDKKYLAVVQGKPKDSKGMIDIPLEKKDSGTGFENMAPSKNGKQAITKYKVLAHSERAALLEVFPVTGRKHQIRAHLAAIGCPIISDKKYNKEYSLYNKIAANLCLHAYELDLALFGEKLKFQAPLPKHFIDVLNFFSLNFKEKNV
ncbi:MAG: RluA family pseudouridine synthase [Candidatus Midichloria sp.]|uniref:Pseudouridine synthase n=1 Tax=Hyalomma marginatum TaxID=34627 RepID=A0A8S4C197_9ACAR|nr:RluA family pseudouridine synthase [Hyalomma marginatum]CAG7593520.1 RluA family pseudouridine synthase [Hyalomma marginatum]